MTIELDPKHLDTVALVMHFIYDHTTTFIRVVECDNMAFLS